ncbi:MAG TPA: type II toxin-antitoxin system RelE/ParE family toxin [Gammaproteobacteria bacterium]|nr:type II toxin-antitoxin system RelE/ParE family toxin [Gammaproteobacteria bacterium]
MNWLPDATRDVERLRVFIQKNNPEAARKASRRILNAVAILSKNPESGMPCPDENCALFRDLYVPFGQGGYTIRYRIQQETVVIVRVWHSREEYT